MTDSSNSAADDAAAAFGPGPTATGAPGSTAETAAAPPPDGDGAAAAALPAAEVTRLTDEVVAALKTVYDPEIPADIYELGLIYRIEIGDDRGIAIDMTLTTPNCPSAQDLPTMVENAVSSIAGVGPVRVEVVWEPPWDPSRMSDEARVVLNMW